MFYHSKTRSAVRLCLLLTVITAVSLLFFSCDKNEADVITDSSVTDTEDTIDAEDESAVPADEEEEIIEEEPIKEPEPVPFHSPLTGLPCEEKETLDRPLAMMINNIKVAIPQPGIGEADIMYECIVEGGITRLMCLFSDYESLPTVGSVRSSRDYYIDLAQAHDAIYAHCGGSPDAYSAISSRHIDNIDGVNGSYAASNAYWKDQWRVQNMGYEHASMTNGEKITESIGKLGYRTALTENFRYPLAFYEEDTPFNGESAVGVSVKYSWYAQAFFSYDKETGLYRKGQYGAPHIDGNTEETLNFKNILLLGASYSAIAGDEKNRLDLYFTGTGKGYYMSDGTVKSIVWTKADRQTPYQLFEEDGTTPLLLNPGKSYIGITDGLGCVTFSEEDANAELFS